ncbi:hypothetical protein CCR97_19110 [Rhodoplanes elegans]|uniref:Uncharacterized protein n=1 Tax=Rhodoplanes elegans TaxID=29408 RepID=A0A327KVM2_9BRAD|nr:hypothetical protein [Rhodoplanes elegans]MBK5960292.1 hypothetical protein [Rhodoplanes elegans]RAI42331.1 hypothetical protein CH338_00035 [Rhodoplanes elegans]
MSATASRPAPVGALPVVHGLAGTAAFLTILTFWTTTVWSELLADLGTVAAVKQAIAWALLLLVPILAVTGLSGFRLAGGAAFRSNATAWSTTPAIRAKQRRMPVIAANGVLILVPCAVTLAVLSARGDFGPTFQAVQALELLAGPVNLALIGLNIRDGLQLAGRREPSAR